MSAVIFILIGLAALIFGGELLVRGAVRLAERAGVAPLVVGLVIVGFGTSMPELVTSVEAVMMGAPGIAWGNIVGSNIANSLLILGAAAALAPIAIRGFNILRDTGVAFFSSLMLAIVAWMGWGHLGIGLAFITLLAVYLVHCYQREVKSGYSLGETHNAPHDKAAALELADPKLHGTPNGWMQPVFLTIAGLTILIVGGRLLVTGAVDVARILGLSETMIGLTIVAIGTSLPELATSVIAALRKQAEVAFGNVIGSNIYNLLGIGGVTMIFAPGALPQELIDRDLPVMVAAMIVILLFLLHYRRFGRLTGMALIAAYVAYLSIAIVAGN